MSMERAVLVVLVHICDTYASLFVRLKKILGICKKISLFDFVILILQICNRIVLFLEKAWRWHTFCKVRICNYDFNYSRILKSYYVKEVLSIFSIFHQIFTD